MIDSDFMPVAFEIHGACSGKFEDFLFCFIELMRFSVILQTFNVRIITQAYLLYLIMVGVITSVILVPLGLLKCCLRN